MRRGATPSRLAALALSLALAGAAASVPSATRAGHAAAGGIAFHGAASTARAAVGTLPLTRPRAAATGDVLLAALAIRGPLSDVRIPTGWSLLRRDVAAPSGGNRMLTQALYLHVVRARDAASASWVFDRPVTVAGSVLAYAGARVAEPIEAHAGRTARTATAAVAPPLRTGTVGAVAVDFFAKARGERLEGPASLRPRVRVSLGGALGVSLLVADTARPQAGTLAAQRAGAGVAAAVVGQSVGLTPAPPDAASEIYVSPSGSTGGNGTFARPLGSLQAALDRARPGQDVVLREGRYAGEVNFRADGRKGAPIILRPYRDERVVIAGRIRITASHVRVSRLVLDGHGIDSDVLVYVEGAQDVEISGNDIGYAPQSGILVGERSTPDGATHRPSDIRILGNLIHDNGSRSDLDHGIYWERGTGGVVGNNVIVGNRAFGIQLYPDADGVLVTQNTIVGNVRSGVIVAGNGREASDADVVANNVIAGNGEFAVRSSWSRGGPVGQPTLVAANLVHANVAGDLPAGFYGEGLRLEADNRDGDPRFADAAARDFHLAADSPARDAARPAWSLPVDRDGRARPAGAGPDIGAYEIP